MKTKENIVSKIQGVPIIVIFFGSLLGHIAAIFLKAAAWIGMNMYKEVHDVL